MDRAVLIALAALAVPAGCGGSHAAPPDVAPDALPACTATFSGNFAEVDAAPTCASLVVDAHADASLELALPVAALDARLVISIALGTAPAPGEISSDTVALWSAVATEHAGSGTCRYSAGAAAVPPGSFELALTAIDIAASTAHGTLALTQYVLTAPGSDCGQSDTEQVSLAF
ncbi:MAG TPA: hypothetical protein VMJ10_32230 [Kofleriaceae bacterium]|nr:hypothetical protein [Kofleriaceae bacterium]